jgi:putative PIN family toxin of toxin-antitoxin system
LIVSEYLLNEVQDVLERPKMRRYLPIEEVPDYLDRVWAAGTSVSDMLPHSFGGFVTSDPDDDYIPGLAIMANSGIIISGDRHLLDLGILRNDKGEDFARILTPGQFLDELR